MSLHYVPFITVLSVLFYFFTALMVGRARGIHKIAAPAVAGNADFERVFRVQQNTLEQMAIFLPVLWIFGASISDMWAGILGVVWIVGRAEYARGYYREAGARSMGFLISLGATGILALCALIKTGLALIG